MPSLIQVITGDTGFIGKHLKAFIPSALSLGGLRLEDKEGLVKFFRENPVDRVYHLAGQAFVPESFRDPQRTFDINFLGTFNLLQALKESGFKGRLLYVSSGDVYGNVDSLPIVESIEPKPRNPYGVSKVAAEALCYQWSQTEGFEIVIARPFNNIGQGQNECFAIPRFAKQIIEKASQIELGCLRVSRDFTDVRDVVRAFELLLEKGKNGEIYNVCSGVERTLVSVIEEMLKIAGSDARLVSLEKNIRQGEQKRVVGSSQKLRKHTGWKPLIPFEQSLRDILSFFSVEV